MRATRWASRPLLLTLPLLLANLLPPAAGQTADGKVTVRAAKFDDLTKTLNGLKGQVVVVDFWADT